ncbi:unnamed protein product [Adineta ricciae]|uniref:Uncharacterized protein n=1 Tax=Adineta ricciae TaxID=249248 RepID=A0A814GBN9_ADIRI|nr:unnamed protein product [Adineta ricciae]CAF0992163.1 unnamed protein product [Adineta ricciae]
MLLFYLILFVSSKYTEAIDSLTHQITKLEHLYPLPTNDKIEALAAQFDQEPNWEYGNMRMRLSDIEESTPNDPRVAAPPKTGPGIIKQGHLHFPESYHGYPVDNEGVHAETKHYIFVVRHGLYLNTEQDASSHLLRYGKYQARMAGDKINKTIRDIIAKSGPLTRPIKLVSSTQTRAFETLYNIRLQLGNDFEYEPEIIQDTGITECVDVRRVRLRWMYFVSEYLQPVKSDRPETTITIVASHGNLLTSFDYIIHNFVHEGHPPHTFGQFQFPVSTGLTHGETLLYLITGNELIQRIAFFQQNEIPITINHAQLGRDYYYQWAALFQCKIQHAIDNINGYVQVAILKHVFSIEHFPNTIKNYVNIVGQEMVDEYETHLLPMLMNTCRTYLYHLSMMQTNTDFGSFSRLVPPVKIPESAEELRTPIDLPTDRFSAYALPFTVDNTILAFKKRDLRNDARVLPIRIINGPEMASAESCFHVRSLLLSVDYNVTEQVTDIGIEFNYFQRSGTFDFFEYQRMQAHYMFDRYFRATRVEPERPSFEVYIFCGDGRYFSGFRHELTDQRILSVAALHVPRYTGINDAGLEHASALFFEVLGSDSITLHDILTVQKARGISEHQRMVTKASIGLSLNDVNTWVNDKNGPCSLKYLIDNMADVSLQLTAGSTVAQERVAAVLQDEWNPYLAGMLIYTCRLKLNVLDIPALPSASNTNDENATANQCKKEDGNGAAAGPSGDCV